MTFGIGILYKVVLTLKQWMKLFYATIQMKFTRQHFGHSSTVYIAAHLWIVCKTPRVMKLGYQQLRD